MHYYATIKRTSTVFSRWTARNAVSGFIDGVRFRRDMKGNYTSGELTDVTIERMRRAHTVSLEAFAAPLPKVFRDDAPLVDAPLMDTLPPDEPPQPEPAPLPSPTPSGVTDYVPPIADYVPPIAPLERRRKGV